MWSSPRYHAFINYDTVFLPDDYLSYDSLNGTADKYFPLYTITETDEPVIEEVKSNGIVSESNTLGLYRLRSNLLKRDVGRKRDPQPPYNSNLELKVVSYVELESLSFNPGWSTLQTVDIQTVNGPIQEANILVRVLGNRGVVEDIYAVDLDTQPYEELRESVDTIPTGVIYKLNDNLWECIKPTKSLPPEDKSESDEWALIEYSNVFNADVYSYAEGRVSKIYTVVEDSRDFDPIRDGGESLVCWNLSYYEG